MRQPSFATFVSLILVGFCGVHITNAFRIDRLGSSIARGVQPIALYCGRDNRTPVISLPAASTNMIAQSEKTSSTLAKRWATGLSLGGLCTGWIATGNIPFALGFVLTSHVMLNEYSAMVRATGTVPASTFARAASALCFLAAAEFPGLHEFVLPISISILIVTLLFSNERPANINEIASSVLAIVYNGYLPSFWVRLHALTAPNFMSVVNSNAIWTVGAAATWWTWTAIVFSDVGAYFAGKRFGRTKLGRVTAAAGAASPNKTVEGALAGFLSCCLISTIGAYVLRWPAWLLTGTMYGLILGVLGLLGDLTASLFKRDAGFKDSGTLLPGHGGLLDRFDSYILSAPVAFVFVKYVLPMIAQLRGLGSPL